MLVALVNFMNDTNTTLLRPPIVAVLGHVDHGKTSLLDAIRKTNVTQGETGGITQHIGAYQVKVNPPTGGEKSQQKADRPLDEKVKSEEEGIITFIDTPGHEAFAKMRARGANAADIAILVIAASEGVKPQTVESIKYIKAANIPFLVALTKMDLPDVNLDKVKQQLASHEVLVENFGGDIVVMPVSAKTGSGIGELLETILLLSGMNAITGDPNAPLSAVVIEARLDKARGPLASVIVKEGTLQIGETIYAENIEAKVRSMMDGDGNQIKVALPSTPVEIMGWKRMPLVGSVATSSLIEKQAEAPRFQPKAFELPPLETTTKLKIILKADVAGS
ncbi:GTP-binding protein, partial [Candidatus Microgenomates bacterium]